MTEEEISKPEDRSIDIMHANEQREKKKLLKNEESIREMWTL